MGKNRLRVLLGGLLGYFTALVMHILFLGFQSPPWINAIGGNPFSRLLGDLTPIHIITVLIEMIGTSLFPLHVLILNALISNGIGSSLGVEINLGLINLGFDGYVRASFTPTIIDVLLYWIFPFILGGLVSIVLTREKTSALILPSGGILSLIVLGLINSLLRGDYTTTLFGIQNIFFLFFAYFIYVYTPIIDISIAESQFLTSLGLTNVEGLLTVFPYGFTFLLLGFVELGLLIAPFSMIAKSRWKKRLGIIGPEDIDGEEFRRLRAQKARNKIEIPLPSKIDDIDDQQKKISAKLQQLDQRKSGPQPPPPPPPPIPDPIEEPPELEIEESESHLPVVEEIPSTAEPTLPDPETVKPPLLDENRFCVNCGARMPPDSDFCEKCGW